MTENPNPEYADLRPLLRLPTPVLSIHLGHVPVRYDDLRARRHALLALMAAHGADDRAVDAVDKLFADAVPGGEAVAVFLGADGVVGGTAHRFPLPGSPVSDLLLRADVPHLLPLLAWRQARPAHVVVRADRSGADITAYPAHGGRPHTRTVASLGEDAGRPRSGSAHRLADAWRHDAARIAEEAAAMLAAADAGLLILAGDRRNARTIADRLPPGTIRESGVVMIGGARAWVAARRPGDHDGGADHCDHRDPRVATAVAAAVDARTAELLAELRSGTHPGGPGLDRAAAVLRALSQGRVRTLFATDRPDDRHTAWFGPEPTDIATHPSDLPERNRPPRRGPLTDVAVRAAMLTGAQVRILRPGQAGAPAEGVGALCRF